MFKIETISNHIQDQGFLSWVRTPDANWSVKHWNWTPKIDLKKDVNVVLEGKCKKMTTLKKIDLPVFILLSRAIVGK